MSWLQHLILYSYICSITYNVNNFKTSHVASKRKIVKQCNNIVENYMPDPEIFKGKKIYL